MFYNFPSVNIVPSKPTVRKDKCRMLTGLVVHEYQKWLLFNNCSDNRRGALGNTPRGAM